MDQYRKFVVDNNRKVEERGKGKVIVLTHLADVGDVATLVLNLHSGSTCVATLPLFPLNPR
jgi:hypothetical protein